LRNIGKTYSAHWKSFDNALYKFTLYFTYFVVGKLTVGLMEGNGSVLFVCEFPWHTLQKLAP